MEGFFIKAGGEGGGGGGGSLCWVEKEVVCRGRERKLIKLKNFFQQEEGGVRGMHYQEGAPGGEENARRRGEKFSFLFNSPAPPLNKLKKEGGGKKKGKKTPYFKTPKGFFKRLSDTRR